MINQQLTRKERCPRCSKKEIITDSTTAEMFCAKCGFVITERVDNQGPERTLSDNTNKSHTGDRTTLTRHDRGLSSIINPINKDSAGNPLSASMKSSLRRLRLWDSRSSVKGTVDRNLLHALSELLKMKDKLSLSDAIAEKAAYIYRKAMEKKLIRGRSIAALVAAALYAACRESGTPRTIKEVSSEINILRRDLAVSYRLLLRELDLKMPVLDSIQCIARIASKAGVSEKTKRHAIKILKKAEKSQNSAGKHPMGLAASSLYLAGLKTGEKISQKQVAVASGVTQVTIRNRCKGLRLLEI